MAGGPRQVRSQWQAGRKSRVHLPLSHRLLTAPPLSCGRSRAVSPAAAFRACLGRRSENFFRFKVRYEIAPEFVAWKRDLRARRRENGLERKKFSLRLPRQARNAGAGDTARERPQLSGGAVRSR